MPILAFLPSPLQLGPDQSSGAGPMEKLQTYRVSLKKLYFKFVGGVGVGVRTKREALTNNHPSNKPKVEFFRDTLYYPALCYSRNPAQCSPPHAFIVSLLTTFRPSKYFPLEIPLLSVILQTFKNFSLLNVVASAAERTVWSQNFDFDPNNAQIMLLFSTHQRKDSLRREKKSILTPHTACLVSMQRAGFII